jgi:SAM-dependent methyltransferase
LFEPLLAEIGPVSRALDFGSGDGWFARQMRQSPGIGEVVPVDVLRREGSLVEPILYDGTRLPYEDRHFDLSYAVDVVHHCPDPARSLEDLLRVTRRFFLLKDHTWSSLPAKVLLGLLDEVGNRRFGVPCVYKHQRGWEWFDVLRAAGFEERRRVHPAPCHVGPMRLVNRFEFVSVWQRMR